MSDVTHEDRATIEGLLKASTRLRFVLDEAYGVTARHVSKIRADDENRKLDVWAGKRMLRFKSLDEENVLVPKEAVDGVEHRYDPWLAQDVLKLVGLFAREKPAPVPEAPAVEAPPEEKAKRSWWKLWASAPKAAPAVDAVADNARIATGILSGKADGRTFGASDLGDVTKAFTEYAFKKDEPSLDRCCELMRRFYISDSEMAQQPGFYGPYADHVIGLLSKAGGVAKTRLRVYLDYLAHDLPDTEVPELAAKGKRIAELLGSIDSGER